MRFPIRYALAAFALLTLPAHAQVTTLNGLSVVDPYACAGDSAVYMSITANADYGDVLTGGSADIAEETELSTYISELGVLRLNQLESLDINDGTTVELVPGGHHFRLYGLVNPLAVGESFPLKMQFTELGEAEIQVPVVACETGVLPVLPKGSF